MKGYTTIEKVENYLLIDVEEYFEPQVEEWIGQVEKMIDRMTGRGTFIAETEGEELAVSEKLYDGDGSDTLLTDDLISIESIEIDDNDPLDPDEPDYYLYPANRTPKNKIKLNGGVFTKGNQNVKVNAVWGYSEDVPEDIVFAATVIVAGIINASGNQQGIRSMTIGNYSVTYDGEKGFDDFKKAEEILKSYKKFEMA